MARPRRVRARHGPTRQASRTWSTKAITAAANAGDTGTRSGGSVPQGASCRALRGCATRRHAASRSMGAVLDRVQRRMGTPRMMSKLANRLYRGSSARTETTVRLLTILAMLLAILAPLAETSPAYAATSIILNPISGPAGTTVTVTGSGFSHSLSNIAITFQGTTGNVTTC